MSGAIICPTSGGSVCVCVGGLTHVRAYRAQRLCGDSVRRDGAQRGVGGGAQGTGLVCSTAVRVPRTEHLTVVFACVAWVLRLQDELQGAPKIMDPVQVSRLKTKAHAIEDQLDRGSTSSGSTVESELEANMAYVREIEKFLKEAEAREKAILGDARVIGDISRCEMVIGTFIVGRILIPSVVSILPAPVFRSGLGVLTHGERGGCRVTGGHAVDVWYVQGAGAAWKEERAHPCVVAVAPTVSSATHGCRSRAARLASRWLTHRLRASCLTRPQIYKPGYDAGPQPASAPSASKTEEGVDGGRGSAESRGPVPTPDPRGRSSTTGGRNSAGGGRGSAAGGRTSSVAGGAMLRAPSRVRTGASVAWWWWMSGLRRVVVEFTVCWLYGW